MSQSPLTPLSLIKRLSFFHNIFAMWLGFLSHHARTLLDERSHCSDMDLFNMIFHKLQSMTFKLNLCRITDGRLRWKAAKIW